MLTRSMPLLAALLMTSASHAQWTQRVAMPTAERINGLVWDGSRFIAVGGFGAVRTSTDGTHWADQSIRGNPELLGIATNGKGTSVALDRDNFAWTTTDGSLWVRSPAVLGTQLGSILWTGTRFLARGNSSSAYSKLNLASTDGLEWKADSALEVAYYTSVVGEVGFEVKVGPVVQTRQPGFGWRACSTGTSQPVNAVARGQGLWVVGGDSGKILTSPDTKSWSTIILGAGKLPISKVAFLGGLWIALGSNYDSCVVYTSSDASVWSRRFRIPGKSSSLSSGVLEPSIVYDSSRWMVLPNNGYSGAATAATSTGGVTWSAETVPGDWPMDRSNGEIVHDIPVSNGTGILVSRGNGLLVWRQGNAPWVLSDVMPRAELTGVAYHDGIWVAAGVSKDSSLAWRSTDGVAWTPSRIRFEGEYQTFLEGPFAARGLFIVSSPERPGVFSPPIGSTLVSEDGLAWTSVTDCEIGFLADNGKVLVSASRYKREVCSSEDGKTWTHRKTEASNDGLWDVQTNGQAFVAIGAGGALWSSQDGIDWIAPKLPTQSPGNLLMVGWNGSTWCVKGDVGTYLSTDAVTWTSTNGSVDNYSIGTTWKGSFLAEDYSTYSDEPIESILTSRDGIDWTPFGLDTNWIHGRVVGYHDLGDTLYALTSRGTPFHTGDAKTWEQDRFTSNAILAMAHAKGLLVAVGENSNIWTRPTLASDIAVHPRKATARTDFIVSGRTLRIPGGAASSAELLDLKGRSLCRGIASGSDLVLDLHGVGNTAAILRVRENGRVSSRMLALP